MYAAIIVSPNYLELVQISWNCYGLSRFSNRYDTSL